MTEDVAEDSTTSSPTDAVSDTESDSAPTEIDVPVGTDADSSPTTLADSEVVEVDGEVTPDVEDSSTGFPAEGVLVRILVPGAHGRAEAPGAVIIVSGLLFGNADTMLWQLGAQSGTITPSSYWQTGPVQLSPGDNTITITAIAGTTSVSDTVIVTYNPGFRFDDALVARPNVLWVGTTNEVVFTIPSALSGNVDPTSMKLVRVNGAGTPLSEEGAMRDDGLLSASGDEIESDGVFTATRDITCTTPGPIYFRASISVQAQPSYTALSSVMRIDCLAHVSVESCTAHKSLIDAAAAALDGGTDLASVVAQLRADLAVESAGPAEGGRGAWVQFDDGLLGAVLANDFPTTGDRGAGTVGNLVGAAMSNATPYVIGSTRALVLSPFATELGETDEGSGVATLLEASECPRYEVETGAALTDNGASLARFRTLSRYGVVSIATHGATLFGGDDAAALATRHGWAHAGAQEVVWTGSAVSCETLLQGERTCVVTAEHPLGTCPEGSRCLVTKGTASDTGASGEGVCLDETQADLQLGRALITNRGYAVTPSFFSAWRGRGLPGSYIHVGACDSMRNGSLASALYAAGAQAVTGFSGAVDSAWARDRALELFAHVGEAGTIDDFHVPAIDPNHSDTRSRLIGIPTLVLDASDLRNGNFETGSVEGWDTSGDGRVVAKFGDSKPINGKFMGLISTGLGYSVASGTMSQTFCVAQGKSTMEIWWRFYSEEFREWCGDETYQDRFVGTLVDSIGEELAVVTLAVDDLCQYQDGTCQCDNPVACDPECFAQEGCHLTEDRQACIGTFNCQCGRYYEGLSPSDIDFDRGGVYRTAWRKSTVDVSGLAGRGPVTLLLQVQDRGDSLFDTAVLVDAIAVE